MADDIQVVARDVPFDKPIVDTTWGGINSLIWIAPANDDEPLHWSPYRDTWLRDFWKKNDLLKIATNTFVQKATTIPIHIQPFDRNITAHIEDARGMQKSLMINSGI